VVCFVVDTGDKRINESISDFKILPV